MKSDFRDLCVWKKGKEVRMSAFAIAKTLPKEEKYRLSDQMIRASRSITSNLVEGYGRYYFIDNIRFCYQSRGSVCELLDHIEVALECRYMTSNECAKLKEDLEEFLALLNGYMRYLKDKKTTQQLDHLTT